MRVPYLSLLALFGLYVLWTPGLREGHIPLPSLAQTVAGSEARASVPVRSPDPSLTPGAVQTADTAKVCSPGFNRQAHHVSPAVRLAVFAAYHIAPDSSRYELDHLIPIALGGADIAANLWPQTFGDGDAAEKYRLENFLRHQVCAGRLPLHEAQELIAQDWRGAYRKFIEER